MAVKELFGEIAAKIADRPGGYTRIIKLGSRADDGADMCFIELVDFDENMAKSAGKKKTRTRRAGKKSSAKAAATEEATPAEAPKAEAPAAEAPAAEAPKAEDKPAEEAPKA